MVMIVTYDLNRPGQTYAHVQAQLKKANGGCVHAQGSVWLIDSTAGPTWWRDALQKLTDANDTVLVARVHSNGIGEQWRPSNMADAAAWLQAPQRSW